MVTAEMNPNWIESTSSAAANFKKIDAAKDQRMDYIKLDKNYQGQDLDSA